MFCCLHFCLSVCEKRNSDVQVFFLCFVLAAGKRRSFFYCSFFSTLFKLHDILTWVLFIGFKVICQNVAYIIKVQSVYVFSKGRLGMSDVTRGPFS